MTDRLLRLLVAAVALLPVSAAPRRGAVLLGLTIYPEAVTLEGPRSRQRLGVLGEHADGERHDLARDAVYHSADEKIAAVTRDGIITPVGDGETVVTIRAGGRSARVAVRVRGFAADRPVEFVREVEPVLTHAGCNQGACHGGQHGKGGFRLSLLAFDPAFDYREIVQAAKGRRVVPRDPERSLLLLKPTMEIDHGGGERLRPGSAHYEAVRDWLAYGAPPPAEGDGTIRDLEVWPRKRRMSVGEKQQLVVRAIWADGRTDDVTDLAKFDSLNEAVATVTADGLVSATGRGETHVMVRFAGQAKVMRVTLPYACAPPAEAPGGNFIDDRLAAKWDELGLAPSPACSDAVFLRRLHLDVLGTPPSPDEVRAFLDDDRPDRRDRAIDRALARPEFVDFWSLKWCDWLRVNRDLVSYKGAQAYRTWVRDCVRANRPLDVMARELLTAQGGNHHVGPANWFLTSPGPEDMGEAFAQLFLGVRMQCARCHHHPFEKWSQEDYCGLAAFFSRVGTKTGEESEPGSGKETVVYVKGSGDVTHPRMDRYVMPRALDGPAVPVVADRRRPLADWLTARDNPFFARNLVNRFWAALMGRGLVEPADDLRVTNPPSNPELLDALADDFVNNGYDFKHLLRAILRSRAYQASAEPTPANAVDLANAHFTRRTPKRLTAEQVAESLDAATDTHEEYPGQPPGTTAMQLTDSRVPSYLLDLFGRPARQAACDCERGSQPSIAQALHLMNGDWLEKKIRAPSGRVAALVKRRAPPAEMIEELYLATLGRLPRPEERTRARRWFAEARSPEDGAADLLWVLVNSREFLFVP